MIWALLAFLSSFCLAYLQIFNQHKQFDGRYLVFCYRIWVILLLLPFLNFVELPQSSLFYALVLTTIPFVYFGDMRLYNLISRFGGGAVSRLMPLKILTVFVFWAIIFPQSILKYLDQQLIGLGIFLSICLCAFSSYRLKQEKVSRDVIKSIMPVILSFAFVDILNKNSMDIASNSGGVYAYILIQSLGIALLFIAVRLFKRDVSVVKAAIGKPMIKGSLFLCLFFLGVMILKNFAFIQTPNPTYVVAIMFLSPVWVTAYNKIIKYPDKTNIIYGLGIVLGVLLLTIFSAF